MNKIIVSLIAILCFSTVSFAETTKQDDKTFKIATLAASAIALGGIGFAAYFGYENNKLTKDNEKKSNDIKKLDQAKTRLDSDLATSKNEYKNLEGVYYNKYAESEAQNAVLKEIKDRDPKYLGRVTALAKQKAEKKAAEAGNTK